MSAILKFDFQKRRQLHFSEENYRKYTKQRHNFACDIYIFLKTRANKNKQWTHLGALNLIFLYFAYNSSRAMDATCLIILCWPGVIYCRVLVKKCPGCLFNSVEIHWLSSNLSWFASLNNKAFGNLFYNPQKSFHTSPESSDSNNRGCQPSFKLNNSTY